MPEEEFKKFIPEEEPKKEKGKNVRITISVSRHGEKTPNEELSELGSMESKEKGKKEIIPEGGVKAYTSPFRRAIETTESELEGIGKQDTKQRIYETKERSELAPPNWRKEVYEGAKKIYAKEGEDGVFRYTLAEPLAQEDLEKWTSGMAFIIDRYRRMANRLNSDTNIKLIHTTHDVVIGDFLRKAAILKDEGGGRIDLGNLDVVGGPIKYLEGFDLEIYLDEEGKEHLKIIFRDREFEVDAEKLGSLVNKYREAPYKGRKDKQDWKK